MKTLQLTMLGIVAIFYGCGSSFSTDDPLFGETSTVASSAETSTVAESSAMASSSGSDATSTVGGNGGVASASTGPGGASDGGSSGQVQASSSSAAGGGGGATDCASLSTCLECDTCTVDAGEPCEVYHETCLADSECSALDDCVVGCSGDFGCLTVCYGMYSHQARVEDDTWRGCVCDNCPCPMGGVEGFGLKCQ